MVASLIHGPIEKEDAGDRLQRSSDGKFEAAVAGTEYFSPDHHGGLFGTVFRRYYAIPDLTGAGLSLDIAHGISPLSQCISLGGMATLQGGNSWLPLPYVDFGSAVRGVEVSVNTTNIHLAAGSGQDWQAGGFIWLDYTK